MCKLKNIAINTRLPVRVRIIAVLLTIISCIIVPSTDGQRISSVYVQFVEKLEDVDSYAWGAALLAFLYCGIRAWKANKKNTVNGNIWILLSFFLIRIPRLQEILQIKLNLVNLRAPLLFFVVEEVIPISNNHKPKYPGSVHELFDSLSDEGIIWLPYVSSILPVPLHDQLRYRTLLAPLFCINYVVHHTPHVFAKQFDVFQKYNVATLDWVGHQIVYKSNSGQNNQNFARHYDKELQLWNKEKLAESAMGFRIVCVRKRRRLDTSPLLLGPEHVEQHEPYDQLYSPARDNSSTPPNPSRPPLRRGSRQRKPCDILIYSENHMPAKKTQGRRGKKEDLLKRAFADLKDKEKQEVNQAFLSLNRNTVLANHVGSNIEITGKFLSCLKPREWVNGEVINVYFELLKEREKREPGKFLKCHFFNTFFYKALIKGGYASVRRWTAKRKLEYGIYDCHKIFVPVHKNEQHWCLAIINIKDEKFHYLDPLGETDAEVLRILAKYYVDEVKEKTGKDVNVDSWMQEHDSNIPRQKNGWDCGMFMIKYADFHSMELKLSFTQDDIPYFRLRTATEILRLKAQ